MNLGPPRDRRFKCDWCKRTKHARAYLIDRTTGKRSSVCHKCRHKEAKRQDRENLASWQIVLDKPEIVRCYELTPTETEAVEKAAHQLNRCERGNLAKPTPASIIDRITPDARRQCQLLGAVSQYARKLRSAA